jgi:hypothetical protein
MKLNNKGFAFSTMLYGALSLIVVVLALVFSIVQRSKSETFYFATEIEDELNECVFEEVALENCYVTNSGCDATSYYACMGISGDSSGATGFLIAEALKQNVITAGDGLYQDSIDAKRYVYKGMNVNNYIKYAGLIWRIVSIEADGSVKVVFPGYTETVEWDVASGTEWGDSSLNNYLNTQIYTSLVDVSGLVKKIWYVGSIKRDAETSYTLAWLNSKEKSSEYMGNSGNLGMFGLPSAVDFVKASLDSTCSGSVLDSTTCNSWLSGYKTWLINYDADSTTEQHAYYINGDHKLSSMAVNTKFTILPTMFLKRTLVIASGTGTTADPYTVR